MGKGEFCGSAEDGKAMLSLTSHKLTVRPLAHIASSEMTSGATSRTSRTTASISVSCVGWFTMQLRRQSFPFNSAFERYTLPRVTM